MTEEATRPLLGEAVVLVRAARCANGAPLRTGDSVSLRHAALRHPSRGLCGTDPVAIDLSLSRVAHGAIRHARTAGSPTSKGWAVDGNGNPATDPEAALAGPMDPFGEAEGTAPAPIVENFAAAMTGAPPGVGPFPRPSGRRRAETTTEARRNGIAVPNHHIDTAKSLAHGTA